MARDYFYKLFLNELDDMYSAENQILDALPEMIRAVSTPELREGLQKHLKETKGQVKRLDEIYSKLGEVPSQTHRCEGMAGILKEGKKVLSLNVPDMVKDAAIIAAAQKVEHYEIASYGTLRTFAKQLELQDLATLLDENLQEEHTADKKLSTIAEGGFFTAGINQKASNK